MVNVSIKLDKHAGHRLGAPSPDDNINSGTFFVSVPIPLESSAVLSGGCLSA